MGAPLLEMPPSDLMTKALPVEASRKAFRRSAWLLCTTLKTLNKGLRKARQILESCPVTVSSDGAAGGEDVERLRSVPKSVQAAERRKNFTLRHTFVEPVDWIKKLNESKARMKSRPQT